MHNSIVSLKRTVFWEYESAFSSRMVHMKIGLEIFGFGRDYKSEWLARCWAIVSDNSSRITQQNHDTKEGILYLMVFLKECQVVFFEITSSVLDHSFEYEVQVEKNEKASLDGHQTTMKSDRNIIWISRKKESVGDFDFIMQFDQGHLCGFDYLTKLATIFTVMQLACANTWEFKSGTSKT